MRRTITKLALCLTFLFSLAWQTNATTDRNETDKCPPDCPTFSVPVVTHAEDGSGRQFVIPTQRLPFTVVSSLDSGVSTFDVEGSSVGGIGGTDTQGLSIHTPYKTVKALSCLDNIWDVSFVIKKWGYTVGDKITIFFQGPDGTKTILAVLTVKSNGVEVTQLNNTMLFLNDRFFANPANQRMVGSIIPFSRADGTLTKLLTLAVPKSRPIDCLQLGVEITRGKYIGKTSLIITDVIVKRSFSQTMTGPDITNTSTGTFPVGLLCNIVCPPCPPRPTKNCTYTQGFYKNHPEAFPVTSLTLGNVTYPKALLLAIYQTPPQGNGLIILAHQLITAKLNAARGITVPVTVALAISAADDLIGDLVVGVDQLHPSLTSSLVETLTKYNEGLIPGGPTHCR